LLLPLRKDILHRAVIFEGDSKRYGIANTKWRSEVAGSGRKVRPQKGTGRARLGDRKSPSLNGGGVAFGPKPRDFSTELPQKVYDLAFRTALSHRYRQGELIVTDGNIDLILDGSEAQQNKEHLADLLRKLLDWNDLRGTTFVTSGPRTGLIAALSATGPNYPVRFLQSKDVEVKSLLEGRRLIIERNALTGIFKRHEDDVVPHLRLNSLSKDHDMY
jgi:large subunit ribosomal protein L4